MERSEPGQRGSVCYPHYHHHHEPSQQHYCTAIRSIDTVRALHQTVVSLRTALDESKREIEKLKKQIDVNSEIQDGRPCHHPGELNRQQQTVDYKVLGDKVSELEKIYFRDHPQDDDEDEQAAKAKENQSFKEKDDDDAAKKSSSITNLSLVPNITVSTQNLNEKVTTAAATGSSSATMASRIDVKIKVSSNINVESNDTMSETSSAVDDATDNTKGAPNEADDEEDKEVKETSTEEQQNKETPPRVEVEMFEDSRANTYTIDASNVKICITSEESVCVTSSKKSNSINQTSTEYLNLDIDDFSEGDNSVFTEGATTPIEQRMRQVDEEIDSEDEVAMGDDGELPREVEKEENEIPEEVDDIELIFSADDNKEGMQDDLVSLSEYEPWNETNEDGTPVLTKFATITSDDLEREAYYQRKRALKAARTKEKLSIDSSQGGRDLSLDSTNSSFDNANNNSSKFTSFEKDSTTTTTTTRASVCGSYSFGRRQQQQTQRLIETDISKVGMDENMPEMSRRNTCPNPPLYRPLSGLRSNFRSPNLAAKFPRTGRSGTPSLKPALTTTTSVANTSKPIDGKSTSSVQTDISALPHQWRSETQLSGGAFNLSGITLPSTSKFNAQRSAASRCGKNTLKLSEKTQEARRVLLSDINFTSMVPELSRSADHLCQQKINEESNTADENDEGGYYKGKNLKAPDDFGRGITPSSSMIASPGVSQWTVNESTTQTEQVYWHEHADSFDSSKCYSLRNSTNLLGQHNRSKSVPSIRCSICKQNHLALKPSESMNYSTKMVTFQEPLQKTRGSLPDLRHDCCCSRRYCAGRQSIVRMHESSGSTDSLLDEADEFLRADSNGSGNFGKKASRRCSEADALRDFHPPKHSLPFLPKTPKCLKTGQLAKVIAKTGRVVVGRIRYCGPVADAGGDADESYVGLQLPSALGDCDGSFGGRKFFECEPNFGMFVPFKKVIMAWNS